MNKILFTEPNRIATVEERKTNTRRIMNPQPDFFDNGRPFCFQIKENSHVDRFSLIKPRYKVGETVYVAEPYNIFSLCETEGNILEEITISYIDWEKIAYKYPPIKDIDSWLPKRFKESEKSGFCNKMFMPEWAARTFIKITDVRFERLQDITDDDCFREGIYDDGTGYVYEHNGIAYSTPREAYAAEIDIINGKGTWDSNPFVWSYYYELVKK